MIILYAILAFIIVILARTLMFKPEKVERAEPEAVEFDADAAVDALAQLIKCKTVSDADHSKEDDAEFEKLISLLPGLYPNVTKTCEFKRFEDRGIMYIWKGREDGDPAVLMAHYDVVPVDEDRWSKPAFEAIIEDDVMWGRGTLDTKVTFNGILSAAENLIKQGFTPKNDIYMCFSGGEEVNGLGAYNMVQYFKEKGINLSLVLDEGGAVVEGVFPGVKGWVGLIGIAEKGRMNVNFDVNGAGGHASAPDPHTSIGKLSQACVDLENHPFKYHMTKPVAEMFDTLGRRSTFLYRMIFANLWCFGWVLDLICKKSGGDMNALMRTTVAFTQMEGSSAPNVLPPSAKMVANIRLNPEDSVASAIDYIKKTINNDEIEISLGSNAEPSPISRTDCEGWFNIKKAVEDTWGAVVSPYLMVQCADASYYNEISDKVYRFSAMDLTKEERSLIHGNNERIRLSTLKKSVEFFIRVIKSC